MNFWKKWLNFVHKLNAYDDIVAECEATFTSANAGGNPEEQ